MAKSSDEIKELQRSINRLQGSDGTVLHLGGRAYLVQAEAVVDPDVLLALLMRETVSEAEAIDGLTRGCELEEPARWIDGRWLGALQRDLRILEKHPDLAGLTRSASRLFRGEVIDRGWLAARRERLDQLQEAFTRNPGVPGSHWEAALLLARCFHGDETAERLDALRDRSTRLSAERRREALERIEKVVLRLEGGAPVPAPAPEESPPADFLDEMAQQLRLVERLPGRARRKRLRPIVAAVLAWPGAPGPVAADEPRSDPADSLSQQIRQLAAWQIAQQGSTRSPEFQERLALCLSRYGLSFPPGPDCAVRFDEPLLEEALRRWPLVQKWLADQDLRLEQVMDLLALPGGEGEDGLRGRHLAKVGGWVVDGLERPLLRDVARLRLLNDLVDEDWDAGTARAYIRWATRLAPHYRQYGIELALTPKAFERLRAARQEELAVLGLCLLEHHAPVAGAPPARQIALLDATLALFQKLPDKARRCLEGLESVPAGLAAALCPDFAAWLEHDPALDRHLHLCGLLGLPQVPSKNLLRDFELAARRAAELAHLTSLSELTETQRQRIAQLSRDTPPPGPGWTKRRLAERNEVLATQLLERRIDQALIEILGRAFGLSLARITPAWRDVFRFFLSTERNRESLGLLLRNATANPGRYFPPSLAKNREWLQKAGERMKAEAWLQPRRRPVELGGRRFTLELEEDPVEVLRMGVPFNTCLSLEDGGNAAATVLNALDVNKRVLYLRDAAGGMVARQLIAVSSDFTFLRYRLYSAQYLPGVVEVFRAMCEEIARESGLPLGDSGEPAQLHDGFWYDDGAAPFAETPPTPVGEYCRFLGLPAPPEEAHGVGVLHHEAFLWQALREKDPRRFADNLPMLSRSLMERELAGRLVARHGRVALAREFRQGLRTLLPALLWAGMEQGPEALLRVARRLDPSSWEGRLLWSILQDFPATPASLKEMAALAVRVAESSQSVDDWGLEHGTMDELRQSAGQLDLALLLDLCDRLSPVWDKVVESHPGCAQCRTGAEQAVLAAAEGVFLRDPDARLVVGCLQSGRRSELAQRVALRILGLFPFPRQKGQPLTPSALQACERAPADAPWVRQALRGLEERRSTSLVRSPEMLAAWIRQGAGVDPATWPCPAEPPFQALRDLVFHVPALVPWLAERFGVPQEGTDAWSPDPFELYIQRQVATPWREHLVRHRAAKGRRGARAALWLRVLERREKPPAQTEAEMPPWPAEHVDAERLRDALRVVWRDQGELAAADASHPELGRALDTLMAANISPDLQVQWLAEIRARTGGALGPLLQERVAKRLTDSLRRLPLPLTPDLLLWLWDFPPLREPVLAVLHRTVEQCLEPASRILRLHRSLQEAAWARAIDPRSLLEDWVLRLADASHEIRHALVNAGDREHFLFVIRTVLSRSGPEQWCELYKGVYDSRSVTLFLDELARQPASQREELLHLLPPDREGEPQLHRLWFAHALAGGSSGRTAEDQAPSVPS